MTTNSTPSSSRLARGSVGRRPRSQRARAWDPMMMIKSQRVFRFNCTGTYEIGGRDSVAKLARPFSPSANESGGLAVSTFRISSNGERVGDSQPLQDRTSSALRARAVLGVIARLLD